MILKINNIRMNNNNKKNKNLISKKFNNKSC